ncbi:unnamed protein product [Sphagnum balticum]
MKQAFEDWRWFLSDNVINSSLVAGLHYGDWVEIPWSKLMVGDIVKVQEDQYFPADLLFLTSPNTDGVCYVEGCSLRNTESAVGVVVFTGHETKVAVLTFFTLLTLYSNIVPISLYVSIEEFFRCLAICRTVLPEGEDIPESIVYQAASPDEFALVAAAKNFGFFFYALALSPDIDYI